MRLSRFMIENAEPILREFEEFARSHTEAGETMDIRSLRDHAAAMLNVIALDIEQPQSGAAQARKSKGDAPSRRSAPETAAQQHGADRAMSGFSLGEMVAEYRALRASVLRLWRDATPRMSAEDMEDLIRFNEGIDQALAESITRYATDLEESREMFLAIMGHDLRTPLSAVMTAAGFLVEEGGLTDRNLTMATRIRRSADRMNTLVRDLLAFTLSRLGRGIPITPSDVDLGEVVREAIDEVRQGSKVDIRFEQQQELRGRWDGTRLSQALANLIGNAVQHGAEGSAVRVTAFAREDDCLVAIQNFGAVIPREDQAKIFDPYQRLLSGESRDSRGSMGLGLFIAREIATAHGGTLEVESSNERGTIFTLRLPRNRS